MFLKLNHKRIKRKFIKFNITTIFFFLLSGISFTFAWFAYSNIVHSSLEIDVSAWHIELRDGEEELSYEVKIPINEFYPGVNKYTKTIEILNKGDIDAEFNYSISSLRILNQVFDVENQENLFDQLAQNYPFLFNVEVDSHFVGKGESILLNIVADWPLDSGDDKADSDWGNLAYNFIKEEQEKASNDNTYEIRSVIEIVLELNTKQYIKENLDITDNRYLYGNIYNINIETLNSCNIGEDNCYNFYVIDKNNLMSDDTVRLILNPKDYIEQGTYDYIYEKIINNLKLPEANQILEAISRDIIDTNIVIPNQNISNRIVGNVTYDERSTDLLNKISKRNGYVIFNNNYFNNLSSDICYWTSTSYNETMNYAIKNNDDKTIKLYGEDKNSNCLFVPVIEITKEPNQN